MTITKINVSDYHIRLIYGPCLGAMEIVRSYVNTTNPKLLPMVRINIWIETRKKISCQLPGIRLKISLAHKLL